jgi:hypothetical protein
LQLSDFEHAVAQTPPSISAFTQVAPWGQSPSLLQATEQSPYWKVALPVKQVALLHSVFDLQAPPMSAALAPQAPSAKHSQMPAVPTNRSIALIGFDE